MKKVKNAKVFPKIHLFSSAVVSHEIASGVFLFISTDPEVQRLTHNFHLKWLVEELIVF